MPTMTKERTISIMINNLFHRVILEEDALLASTYFQRNVPASIKDADDGISEMDFLDAVSNDPRFCVTQVDTGESLQPDSYISLGGEYLLCEEAAGIRALAENWRREVVAYLQEDPADVSLSTVAAAVPRPKSLPTFFKFIDILRLDPLKRFDIVETSLVKEVNLKAEFKTCDGQKADGTSTATAINDRVAEFLSNHKKYPVADLVNQGVVFKFPKHMDRAQYLLEIMRADDKKRFTFNPEGTLVGLSLAAVDTTAALHWLNDIANHMRISKIPVIGLSEIAISVPRPASVPKSVGLKDLFLSDPKHRFTIIYDREKSLCKVQMNSVKASVAAAAKKKKAIDDNGWRNVSSLHNTQQRWLGEDVSTSSDNTMSNKHELTTHQEENSSPAFASFLNAPSTSLSTQAAVSSILPSSFPPGLSSQPISNTANSTTAGFDSNSNFHSSWNEDYNFASAQQSFAALLQDLSVDSTNNRTCGPSSSATLTTPIEEIHNSTSNNNVDRNVKDVSIKEWFQTVMKHYDSTVVDTFVDKFNEEGFVIVDDLLISQSMGQLTLDFAKEIAGMKLGHYNRLIAELNAITSSLLK